MWELDYKEGWVPKKWCFQIMVLKKTLDSPSDCKKIKPVNPKGNQVWIFIGRTVAEAGTPIFWPPDAKSWLIRKYLDAGKDREQERWGQQRMRWLDSITESMGMSLSKLWKRVKNVDGSLACCSPWCCRVGHDLGTGQQHHIYLGIIFIPPASSKGIKGYKVVWLKDLLVGFYGLHALKFQIMRGHYLGRQCTQTIKETAVASSHKIEM